MFYGLGNIHPVIDGHDGPPAAIVISALVGRSVVVVGCVGCLCLFYGDSIWGGVQFLIRFIWASGL